MSPGICAGQRGFLGGMCDTFESGLFEPQEWYESLTVCEGV